MRDRAGILLVSVCAIAIAAPAYAQSINFNIPAGDLKSALDAYSAQSGSEIIYKVDQVRGVKSPGARGPMSAEAALEALLAGTAFRAQRDPSGALAIIQASADPNVDEVVADEGITVTGSRIRGAVSASPVIRITATKMRDSGHATFGEVIAALPQNFWGGQNPGLINSGENVNSSTTMNLRGLGPDATLTLLNGHRLAYDSVVQGIDISAIPIAAVERLEIVADGASAIYGSDAVGGVANIILKRDYSGLTTSSRLGASTDGGNAQAQFDAVAGATWDGGGVIATVDYSHYDPILARERDYTPLLNAYDTLIPGRKQISGVISGHTTLTQGFEVTMDATYSKRDARKATATTTATPATVTGQLSHSQVESYSATPTLKLPLFAGWRATVSGTYAKDKTHNIGLVNRNGVRTTLSDVTYSNTLRMGEASAEGPLFSVGGESARLAVGGGYRSNSLLAYTATTTAAGTSAPNDFDLSNDSWYLFAEANVPIISPGDDGPVDRLSLTGALRYENYGSIGKLATPRLGVIFSPIPDITLRATWGRSFKAPTLFQRFGFYQTVLFPAASFGAGYPTSATAIYRIGGNRDLKSERAKTWTISAEINPRVVPGFKASIAYFNINYSDRISSPISVLSGVFADQSYAPLVTLNPTASQVSDSYVGAAGGLINATGRPYDPATVVAIVDNRNVNISSDKIRGVDIASSYSFSSDSAGTFTVDTAATYLRNNRRLVPASAPRQLAGTIFDPPHWRGRGGLTWSDRAVTMNASVNYIGSFLDDRTTSPKKIGALTTVDLTARYVSVADHGILRGFEIGLSVQNIFNQKPRLIAVTLPVDAPYDSTNHSAIGRFASLTLSKAW